MRILNRITAISGSKAAETLLIAIVIISFSVKQLPDISNPPWENYDSWRQSDTYSMALNFYQYEYNILKPQLNYDGAADNYVQLELQITTFLAATVFKLLGTATPLVSRAISLLLFIGSAVYTYLVMKRFAGTIPSLCGLAVYMFLPISMLYSRAIMPESSCLFFYCGGVYYLMRWYMDDKKKMLWLSSFFIAIAITQKTPIIFIGILILFVFIRKMGKECLRSWVFYGYGMIALIIPAAYYIYASRIAVFSFVSGITKNHLFSEEILSVFTLKGLKFLSYGIGSLFGWAVIAFAALGALVSFKKKHMFVLIWSLSIGLEWLTIAATIRLGYYLIFMAPVFAVLCAVSIYEMWNRRRTMAVLGAATLICYTGFVGIRKYDSSVKVNEKIESAGTFIKQHTGKEAAIAIASINPAYINAANRRGYRANIKYYNTIPQAPNEEIGYFIKHGVKYFIIMEEKIPEDNNGYMDYVESSFPILAEERHCKIYVLNKF